LIKDDLLAMFEDFHKDKLVLYRLNFALITIIPKKKDARTMNKFRPTGLLIAVIKFLLRCSLIGYEWWLID
jgi:hypothetical protein